MLKNEAFDYFIDEADKFPILFRGSKKCEYTDFKNHIYDSQKEALKEIKLNIINMNVKSQIVYLKQTIKTILQREFTFQLERWELEIKIQEEINNTKDGNTEYNFMLNYYKGLSSYYEKRDEFDEYSLFFTDESEIFKFLSEKDISYHILHVHTQIYTSLLREVYSLYEDRAEENTDMTLHWDSKTRYLARIDLVSKENKLNINIENNIASTTTHISPLKWLGKGIELAALFAELEAKGYIELHNPTDYYGPTREQICRSILSLFELTSRRDTSQGEAWKTLAAYLKAKNINKRTGKISYYRLTTVKNKFNGIIERKSAPNGS